MNGLVNNVGPRGDRGPFLGRVRIRNYKSIECCDISLSPLTVLVGRNGAGKSNFLDALRFVAEGLQTSLDHAIKSRGGMKGVRRRSTGHPRNFAIQVELNLPNRQTATYAFEIGARPKGGFVVRKELLYLVSETNQFYRVEDGRISSSCANMPAVAEDRLYLVSASGLPEFRAVYDALASMGFYNINPEAMKELQSPDAGEILHRDGGNIASVIARLSDDKPGVKNRIKEYLTTIVPGITGMDRVGLGPSETLEFRQEVVGSIHPWTFYAASMSDGTLRALGTLVAVMQLAGRKAPVSLVGIEEPETALHPAATADLMGAFREAGSQTQVLITTHSPDLVEHIDVDKDALLVVASRQGNTAIGPADKANYQVIRQHLYDAGELLRMDQLAPDEDDIERQEQLRFEFDTDREE